ncbi:hypothetical protein DMH01_35805 [Amycolatopsis sp. WAC 04182]|uniref:hypothetical protein n=1 Tax=Amycolatopsis sp. WAC 04182 TaxID=2203198 RepID=UPI000F778C9A|nr:hypothetical protein [Amycolatopsis sp. WAC 04182]RSN54316.1 hypothetical protein DMH01_35805 [Amycolatopsis sp. WAC 04182]
MGQGFSVEPDAVRALGDLVLRASAGADSYRRWFDRLVSAGAGFDTERGEGFLAAAWSKLDEWQRAGLSQSRFAADLAAGGGHELRCVAHWYGVVDARAAELLDRLNPEPDAPRIPVDEVRDPAAAAVFRDAVLVGYGGPDPNAITDPAWWPVKAEQEREKLLDLGGSLGDVAEVIKMLTGSDKDFITMLADLLVGDWTVLQEQAVLYHDAAIGLENIAANINQGRFGIQGVWKGEAADRAKNWLADYRSCVLQLAQYFHGACRAIQALAKLAYHMMQEIRHGYSSAIDIVLLILTKGKKLGLERGVRVAEVISEALSQLGQRGKLITIFQDPELRDIIHLVLSFNEIVGIIQTWISAALGLAHAFAGEKTLDELLEATIAMGEPPQWPEGYEHRDAECPAKGRGVRL